MVNGGAAYIIGVDVSKLGVAIIQRESEECEIYLPESMSQKQGARLLQEIHRIKDCVWSIALNNETVYLSELPDYGQLKDIQKLEIEIIKRTPKLLQALIDMTTKDNRYIQKYHALYSYLLKDFKN